MSPENPQTFDRRKAFQKGLPYYVSYEAATSHKIGATTVGATGTDNDGGYVGGGHKA